MKPLFAAFLLALGIAALPAQTPSAPATRAYSSPLGFSYSFPADWQVVDMSATLPDAQKQAQQKAASEDEKRGAACIQIALSARHGSPVSTVVALVLPFACLGSEMTEKDLPGMASGAIDGISPNFNLGEPVFGSYSLGRHSLFIERVSASLKGNMGAQFTIESVCTLVEKGAVCWMAMAATDPDLAVFEHGLVTLDKEPPTALVPADAFQKKTN
ncbi:MAG: hypothetical protein WCE75_05045 [Terracidiphilus sp.]